MKAYRKKWYAKNKKTHCKNVRKNNDRYIDRNREFILDYLSNHPCVDCGEPDPVVLEFDHREDKSFAVAEAVQKKLSIKKIRSEIAKCDVRCANCHRRKTAESRGHFRSRSATGRAPGL